MKKILILLFFVQFVGVYAQTDYVNTAETELEGVSNPIDVIMNESNGNILIDIPDYLLPSILKNEGVEKGSNKINLKTGVNRLNGYRIQVFMDGRNQNTLESRAKARGNLILSRFPKYTGQIYTYSKSPNWYCRVGNFMTTEEANEALTELKKAFPNYSGEMRIVRSPIIVIK